MSADSQNDAADNGQVAEEPPQLPASSAEVSQLRNEQLGNIRETAERLRDAINELSRLEHGIPGLSSAFLQGGVIETDFPDDAEIKEELAQLNPLIDEFLRLSTLNQTQASIFQDHFDDTLFKLLMESKDGFLQTASYFEKLALLAVAVLGASISGLMAVVGHLPPDAHFQDTL